MRCKKWNVIRWISVILAVLCVLPTTTVGLAQETTQPLQPTATAVQAVDAVTAGESLPEQSESPVPVPEAPEEVEEESPIQIAAPGQVTGISIRRITSHSVQLSWTPVKGASGYYVYRSEPQTKGYKRIRVINSARTARTNDTDVLPGARYGYKVVAYTQANDNEARGASSKLVTATPRLASPGNIVATPMGTSSIQLSWNQVLGAEGYSVYRSTRVNGGYARVRILSSGKSTSMTDSSLTSGTTYYYKVRPFSRVINKNVAGLTSPAVHGRTLSPTPSRPSPERPSVTGTVYWTPNDKRYHLSRGCPTLRQSRVVRSGTISGAGSRTRCRVCG